MLVRYFNHYVNTVRAVPRAAQILCGVAFLNFLGYMVLPFLSLYLTKQRGLDLSAAAWILSAYGLGAVIGAYLGGYFCNRHSPYRVMITGLLASGVLLSALGAMPTHTQTLMVFIFLIGVGANSFRPALNVALSEACNEKERAQAYALYRVLINLATCVGISVGAFLSTTHFNWICALDGLSSVAAAGFLWRYRGQLKLTPKLKSTAEVGNADAPASVSPWKNYLFLALCLIVLLITLVDFQVNSSYPVFITQVLGFSEVQYGRLFVLGTVMILLFEIPLIDFLKRYDSGAICALGAFILCLGPALLPWMHSGFGVVLSFVIWNLGEMILWPTNLSYLSARIENDPRKGTYYGIYGGIFSLCHLLSPPVGGALYTHFSPKTLWLSCGFVGVVAGVAFLVMPPQRFLKKFQFKERRSS